MKRFLPILALGLLALLFLAEPALAQDTGGDDIFEWKNLLLGALTVAFLAFVRAISNSIPDSAGNIAGFIRQIASLFTGKTADKP